MSEPLTDEELHLLETQGVSVASGRLLIEQLRAARKENDRIRGLLGAEMNNTPHYCETCEMAYQRPEGNPTRCPYCEIDTLNSTGQELREALRAVVDGANDDQDEDRHAMHDAIDAARALLERKP